MWRRRCRDLAADVVEEIRASLRREVVLSWHGVKKTMSASHSETLASALALAQGGAELRRGGFEVVGVGWLAGAVMVARVVVAGNATGFGRGGNGGEEEGCDGEGLHCGLIVEG